MGDWSILGRLLTEVQNHSTVIGKIWLTMLLIFRILLVTLVGDAMYGDEQSKFTCNTLQPGCNNVCYDSFAPVSHLRFWIFQIVLVSTPSIFYIIYVLHKIAKDEKTELERAYVMELLQNLSIGEHLQKSDMNLDSEENMDLKDQSTKGGRFRPKLNSDTFKGPIPLFDKMHIIYIVHVVLRSAMEMGFLVGQYYIFGFEVPHLFQCDNYPCPTTTDCFVSRATEKTVFLNFMFGVGLGCFILNIVELHYLGWFYVFRGLTAACYTCCEFKAKKKKKMMVLHPEQNSLLIHLKDTIQERFVLKTSSSLSQEKNSYLPTQPTAISFANDDDDDNDGTKRKNPDIKHSNLAKISKIKKSWL
ncbi:gap junction delta-2 protein-like [Spea bombifrons]|uniref:gap junction delta-2 protein-like n=1 Tax=Spea bombifrons TaxID=233779 RepID=UPI00234AF3EA|nr:gap junction delta-2 protein-like [Spea bombifrons]